MPQLQLSKMAGINTEMAGMLAKVIEDSYKVVVFGQGF